MDGSALILCEGAFGAPHGKTANGLVRFTERYQVMGVIDSCHSGKDAGEVLDGKPVGIPIFADLRQALDTLKSKPDYLVVGLAPDGGRLPDDYRKIIENALKAGLNVDSGLHEFLSEDARFSALAREHGVTIRDVRKPPPRDQLHFFTGRIEQVKALRIAFLGTDSAIGKRTTAVALHRALCKKGVRSVLIGTGQTAWFQGIRHCMILDSIVNDFVSGEIEHTICTAEAEEQPEVMLLEGQGNLTNPAFPGGFELVAAGRPQGLIVQHAPRRRFYDGFPGYPLAGLDRELEILRLLSSASLLAITLNHEEMTREEVEKTVAEYERRYGVPVCDVIWHGTGKLEAAVGQLLNNQDAKAS